MIHLPLPCDVSPLLAWVEAATPGTLIPAGELAERLRALPMSAVANDSDAQIPDEPDRLLTADAVAEWLEIDKTRVYRMARQGQLPSVRLGGNTVRFKRNEVERWLARRAR